MGRLTITLSDVRHEQLRLRAARARKSLGQLIEDELAVAEQARRDSVLAILEQARANAASAPPLSEDELMEVAVRATHEVREEMAAEKDG